MTPTTLAAVVMAGGRGTRMREDYGKMFFNILDYTGSATQQFADPSFDGFPEIEHEVSVDAEGISYHDDFVFIDPRGTEEQDFYDYGKLMQSFVLEYESHIYNERNSNYIQFCKAASDLMYERYNKSLLNFYLAVHLLGAVPFFEMNSRVELAKLFLDRGHKLFDELGIKYKK